MTTRTALVKTTPKGSYPSLPIGAGLADVTMAAADIGNMNYFPASGNDLLIAYNSGASTYTVTITSMPDQYGRSGDIATYSMAAGDIAVFGPFKRDGWVQTDGNIYLQASNAAVKFGVITLP
jgi:hypothetical protein